MKIIQLITVSFFVFFPLNLSSQALKSIDVAATQDKGLQIRTFNGFQQLGYDLPFVSLRINDKVFSSLEAKIIGDKGTTLDNRLQLTVENIAPLKSGGFNMKLRIKNISNDTLKISNIVPFGESKKQIYLTSGDKGDPLSRAFIYRPGFSPVNVTLPDNSWGIGLGIVDVDNGSSVVALSKIDKTACSKVGLRRFYSSLYPDGVIVCNVWMDSYIGRWQEGLRLMFQKNMLFDVEPGTFDNWMYERADLKWVRKGFVGHFISAWHNYFYDGEKGKYTYFDFDHNIQKLFGGNDVMVLWSGFPVLGLDQRNQWDLMRALPGGVEQIRKISSQGLKEGMHLMTNYKPWDLPASYDQLLNSTHYENPMVGLGSISQEAGFSGVMFDTRSESSKYFQTEIDQFVKGFAVFPEGMCIPADMQNCVIGRTHAAIEYAPFLNLNKLIKPDFAIYRQVVVDKENPRRDISLAFFGGHGVEFHTYLPWNIDWLQELYAYTGKTVRILRENADNFVRYDWTPLLPTTTDSVWVNEWPGDNKNIYTIYNLKTKGFNGSLFEVSPKDGWHYVDLWHNKELKTKCIGSKYLVEVKIDSFPARYLGTRAESSVSCVAYFPRLISVSQKNNQMTISVPAGKLLKVWKGNPSYAQKPAWTSRTGKQIIKESEFREDHYAGDIVLQLFEGNSLLDECIVSGSSVDNQELFYSNYSPSKGETTYDGPFMKVLLQREKDLLNVTCKKNVELKIYPKDNKNQPALMYNQQDISIKLLDAFGRYEGDFVVVAKQNEKTVDSTNVNMPYGYARIASVVKPTKLLSGVPHDMCFIPAGRFTFNAKHIGDWMIKYPTEDTAKVFDMKSFYIDKHPVTNVQFKEFLDATNYKPIDYENFLKHWPDGNITSGEENHPVTFVSYEDAQAYAFWAGKRLPTEKEWQYAAQTDLNDLYPWGNKMDSTKCNTGNGFLDPIGKYPQAANKFGLEELTGSVWQLTNDLYKNGTVSFIILKGGSYFIPRSSWWYVTGGALPLIYRQQLLRVSQGYERNATVGFRLVSDCQ